SERPRRHERRRSGSSNIQRQSPLLGDHSERDPPVPIPNTAVKPLRPDGTARASVWESRKSPASYFLQITASTSTVEAVVVFVLKPTFRCPNHLLPLASHVIVESRLISFRESGRVHVGVLPFVLHPPDEPLSN